MKTLLLLAISAALASASTASVQWDVRTTGNANNGGCFDPTVTSPGTDYSQQSAPHIAYTDIGIGGSDVQLTSAAHPFTADLVGNCINLVSGTGLTGMHLIVSVAAGVATVDWIAGFGGETIVANVGGALASPANINVNLLGITWTSSVAFGTVNIRSGTYTLTSAWNPCASYSCFGQIVGYQTTHGDGGAKPLIATATNSTDLLTPAGGTYTLSNLAWSNTAGTRARGLAPSSAMNAYISGSTYDGFTTAVDGTTAAFNTLIVEASEIANASAYGVYNQGGATVVRESWIHDCAVGIAINGAPATPVVERSILSGNGYGVKLIGGFYYNLTVGSTAIVNSTNDAINIGNGLQTWLTLDNSILYGNAGWGLQTNGVLVLGRELANAFGANVSGNCSNNGAACGLAAADFALTSDPFVNRGSGNFALNATAGGGKELKGAGYPGLFPGGLSHGYLDIGPVQTRGAAIIGNVAY